MVNPIPKSSLNGPKPHYARKNLADINDPNLIYRAMDRACKQREEVSKNMINVEYVHHAHTIYNRHAFKEWYKGQRQRALQILWKAAALTPTDNWMERLMRAKTRLNIAFMLIRLEKKIKAIEVLDGLVAMISNVCTQLKQIIRDRGEQSKDVTEHQTYLREACVIYAMTLREYQLVNRIGSDEAMCQCIEVFEGSLADEHPIWTLFTQEKTVSELGDDNIQNKVLESPTRSRCASPVSRSPEREKKDRESMKEVYSHVIQQEIDEMIYDDEDEEDDTLLFAQSIVHQNSRPSSSYDRRTSQPLLRPQSAFHTQVSQPILLSSRPRSANCGKQSPSKFRSMPLNRLDQLSASRIMTEVPPYRGDPRVKQFQSKSRSVSPNKPERIKPSSPIKTSSPIKKKSPIIRENLIPLNEEPVIPPVFPPEPKPEVKKDPQDDECSDVQEELPDIIQIHAKMVLRNIIPQEIIVPKRCSAYTHPLGKIVDTKPIVQLEKKSDPKKKLKKAVQIKEAISSGTVSSKTPSRGSAVSFGKVAMGKPGGLEVCPSLKQLRKTQHVAAQELKKKIERKDRRTSKERRYDGSRHGSKETESHHSSKSSLCGKNRNPFQDYKEYIADKKQFRVSEFDVKHWTQVLARRGKETFLMPLTPRKSEHDGSNKTENTE